MTLRWHPGRWWLGVAGALVALLCAGFAWGEWAGWPWLAQPLAKGLGQRLGRQVQFGADGAGGLQVAPPAWAADRPPTLEAHGVQLDLRYRDLLRTPDGRATWQFGNGTPDADGPQVPVQVRARATGRVRQEAVTAALRTEGPLPWVSGPDAVETRLAFDVQVGQAALAFDGQAQGLATLEGLRGTFGVGGLSLAPVGRALGVTLLATVGRSSVHGQVQHDTVGGRGRLTGSLVSPLFQLRDLAPAIGAPHPGTPAPAVPPARRNRTLPDHPFDLAALRAMDADVQLSFARLDLGTPALQAVQALDTRLRLDGGVLVLDPLTARLADGRVTGRVQLDGRQSPARWDTDLQVRDLRLEHWIRAAQRSGQPPYLSGRLGMTLKVTGRGRSTAELLWTQGTLSHLLVEVAGLDVAQGLGVFLVGDDALPVTCGAADLRIRDGQLTPTVLLVDTRDSTLWVEGQASFVRESLALTAQVHPKDFSPLSLRSPLRVEGTFAAPRVQLERGALLRRLGPAALLALVTPR